MDFELGEEQSILKDAVRRLLADRHDFDQRRRLIRNPSATADLWQELVGMGLMGAPFSEKLGGYGGGPVEAMIVMEALGETLLTAPWAETVLLCGRLLEHLGSAASRALLEQAIAQEVRPALAHWEKDARTCLTSVRTTATPTAGGWRLNGTKGLCIGADRDSHLLVSARTSHGACARRGLSLFLVAPDTPGVTLQPVRMIDDRTCADIVLDAVDVPAAAALESAGDAHPAIARAHEDLHAALCAEAIGVLDCMLRGTIDYTRQRRQFGQPLSQFQVIRHRLVDMYMQVEMARSACHLATLSLTKSPNERSRAVMAAKIVTGDALRVVGEDAIQLHGAMGLTDELAISHYFRRATVLIGQLGSEDANLGTYAALLKAA